MARAAKAVRCQPLKHPRAPLGKGWQAAAIRAKLFTRANGRSCSQLD